MVGQVWSRVPDLRNALLSSTQMSAIDTSVRVAHRARRVQLRTHIHGLGNRYGRLTMRHKSAQAKKPCRPPNALGG